MMTIFWTLIAVLVVLALLFIWWPWLTKKGRQSDSAPVDRNRQNIEIFKQRVAELEAELDQGNLDQASFEALKVELEQNLLQEVDDQQAPVDSENQGVVWVPVGLTLLVPLLSLFLYMQWGASDKLTLPKQVQAEAHPETGHDLEGIEGQIAALLARLEAQPSDSQGWFTLGRTYMTLERYDEAFWAFGKVMGVVGEQAEILAQQAQVLYFKQGRQITAEVQALLDRAMELDPQDAGTLGLMGVAAFESQQFEKAIGLWQQMLQSDRPGLNREGLLDAIEQAKAQLAQRGTPYQGPELEQPAATGASLKVLVELDGALKDKVSPATTVFVTAQHLAGPPMPLAAARLQVRDLPTLVTLDDSMAMTPMAKLSSAKEVKVRATVSLSGSAGAKPGDMIGMVSPITVAGNDELIKILINEVVQ